MISCLGLLLCASGSAMTPIPESAPNLTAASAILIDADSGTVLFSKDAHAKRFPASTTKVLTALLLIENCKMTDKIAAPLDVKTVGESSIYLEPGETLTAHDALYALMVRSANDVAYAVACHIAGNVERFSELMNKRARELGCSDSNFHNPHGLNDKLHVTSAHDLALIAREAMKHPEFREACRTRRITIDRSMNQLNRLLISKDKFLDDPNAEGIKTGWTVPAGKCFVGAKSVGGWRLISVVLKSADWLADTCALMDYGFAKYERVRCLATDSDCGNAPVAGGTNERVTVRASRDLFRVCERGGIVREPRIELRAVQAPIEQGEVVGKAVVQNVDGSSCEAPLIAAESVSRAPLISLAGGFRFSKLAIVIALIVGGALVVRSRSRVAFLRRR